MISIFDAHIQIAYIRSPLVLYPTHPTVLSADGRGRGRRSSCIFTLSGYIYMEWCGYRRAIQRHGKIQDNNDADDDRDDDGNQDQDHELDHGTHHKARKEIKDTIPGITSQLFPKGGSGSGERMQQESTLVLFFGWVVVTPTYPLTCWIGFAEDPQGEERGGEIGQR